MRRLLVVAAMLSLPASAASISGVSGTVSDGQSITVSGSGFGSTGPTVVLFDDFERQASGDQITWSAAVGAWTFEKDTPLISSVARSGTRSVELSGYTSGDMPGGHPCSSTSAGGGGSESLHSCDNSANYQELGVDFVASIGTLQTDVYWEYSWRIGTGSTFLNNSKIDWVYGHSGGTNDTNGNDWRFVSAPSPPNPSSGYFIGGMGSNCGAENCLNLGTCSMGTGSGCYPLTIIERSAFDQWFRQFAYVKASTGCSGEIWSAQAPFVSVTADEACQPNVTGTKACNGGANNGNSCSSNTNCSGGSCEWVRDNNTCEFVRKIRTAQRTTCPSYDPSNLGFGRLAMNGYHSSGTPSSGHTHLYWDDVYIAVGAGARARIEISNQQTWGCGAYSSGSTYQTCAAALDMTICTPTSWASGSVACTVRQGSFAGGATAYLFVIDASGNVSDQDGNSGNGYQGYQVTLGATAATPRSVTGAKIAGGSVR